MTTSKQTVDHVRALRRYATALLGSSSVADDILASFLKCLVARCDRRLDATRPVELFARFEDHIARPFELCTAASEPLPRLGSVPLLERKALLLTDFEEFSPEETAEILSLDRGTVDRLLESARSRMSASSRRILIIEDQAPMALELEWIVQKLGHEPVGLARTERQALALARRSKPDLLIADVNLRGEGDGLSAVSRIRAESGPVPTIFITGLPARLREIEDWRQSLALLKPVSSAQVGEAIERALILACPTRGGAKETRMTG